MVIRADHASRTVYVGTVLDLPTAQAIRAAVLRMSGDVVIDLHEVRTVHDSALAYLVTTLRLANRSFSLRGLGWPHTRLLEYLGQAAPRREPGS
jgi:anti-anti-sigma regulatory factor